MRWDVKEVTNVVKSLAYMSIVIFEDRDARFVVLNRCRLGFELREVSTDRKAAKD